MTATEPPRSEHATQTANVSRCVCEECGSEVNYFLWHVGSRVVNQPCGHVSRWEIKA